MILTKTHTAWHTINADHEISVYFTDWVVITENHYSSWYLKLQTCKKVETFTKETLLDKE